MKTSFLALFLCTLATLCPGAPPPAFRWLVIVVDTNGYYTSPTNVNYVGEKFIGQHIGDGSMLTNLPGGGGVSNNWVGSFTGDASGLTNFNLTLLSSILGFPVTNYDTRSLTFTNGMVVGDLIVNGNLTVNSTNATTILSNLLVTGWQTNSGVLSASNFIGKFYGDGSGLTNLPVGSTSNNWVGSFTGDGAGLSNVTATVSNVALLINANSNRFSGSQVYSNKYAHQFYPSDTNTASGGIFQDWHRPLRVTPMAIRWFDDDSTEVAIALGEKPYISLGPDITYPDASFLPFYDNVIGKDVFNIGNYTTNRGHFGFNSLPVGRWTLGIFDNYFFGTPSTIVETNVLTASSNTMYTVAVYSRSNGIFLNAQSMWSDSIEITKDNTASGHYLKFEAGNVVDWRVGLDTNSYDLVIRNSGTNLNSSPQVPGNVFMRFTPDHTGYIQPSAQFEVPIHAKADVTNNVIALDLVGYPRQFGRDYTFDTTIPTSTDTTYHWIGFKFAVVPLNDLMIKKVGIWSWGGLTNGSHVAMVCDQAGSGSTNGIVQFPKTTNTMCWVWADCAILCNAGSTNVLIYNETGDVMAFESVTIATDPLIFDTRDVYGDPPKPATTVGSNKSGGPINYLR